jgi:tetratricopeptide (TPR) repeat protein
MRKHPIFGIFCSFLLLCNIKGYAVSTPEVVTTFYQTLHKLSQATSDSQATYCQDVIQDCFLGRHEVSGINVPNDFYSWGYKAEKHIPSNVYSFRAYTLFYKDKKLKMSEYSIENSEYISEVDLEKYKNKSKDLIQTVVKKTFTDGKISKTFSDTLIIEHGKISVFNNADTENINALRALAARYYSSKQYFLAYQTYERILKIEPKNANAYYRLGLMTFWRQGCYYSSKTAHKKGLEYAEKAKSLGYYKAETAIYYMKTKSRI